MCVITSNFLACEDIADGSDLSAGECFFAKYGGLTGGSPLSGGGIIILCVIRRNFRWVRADSGGKVFFAKYGGPFGGSQQSGGNFFSRNTEALPMGPSCQVEESLFCA